MKMPIETKTTRLLLRGGKVKLQSARSLFGFPYWKTLKTYKTMEEFRSTIKR